MKVVIRPSETADYIVFGLLVLTWGILLGISAAHGKAYIPEYLAHQETKRQKALVEFSNEILSSNSDRQACWALAANQTLLGLRGFETVALWAEEAKEQLTEGMIEACIKNRGPY